MYLAEDVAEEVPVYDPAEVLPAEPLVRRELIDLGQLEVKRELTLTERWDRLEAKRVEARKFLEISRAQRHGKRRGKFQLPREIFDPTNKEHLKSYKAFVQTGNWGSVLFCVQFPHDTVTETVAQSFANYALDKMIA